jgi:hypothetical protein
MRRRITVAILAGAFAALLVAVPRWTAAKAEAKRKADFDTASSRAIPVKLPACPPPGPQRDHFLIQSATALTGSRNLWVPVCRVAPLPAHRILVMVGTRAELNDCKVDGSSKSVSACVLEEPIGLLADAGAPRTWARRESREAIWLTSISMAWNDHLIAEHRQRMMLSSLLISGVALLFIAAWRTRQAWAWRDACHRLGGPNVPGTTELLLHWVLGRGCRSLPGDLGEEYAARIEDGFSVAAAKRWYRWQVFHSVAPVAARRVESALTRGFGWKGFKRRG